MNGRLDGRTALVTGSTSGLGRAMALADEAERLLGGRVDILVNNAGIVPIAPPRTSTRRPTTAPGP